MAGVVQPGKNCLHAGPVARLGGADEIVMGQLQLFGERLPVRREAVAVGLRILLVGLRRLLDFLAMLVQAGQEKNLLAQAAPGAGEDVGDDLLVGVPEVGLTVDVINRRGDVKPFAHSGGQNDGHWGFRQSHLQQKRAVVRCPPAVAENQP